jgi:hypothetical protein
MEPPENLAVDGFDGRAGTGFVWLRIHSSNGFLKNGNEPAGFKKCLLFRKLRTGIE